MQKKYKINVRKQLKACRIENYTIGPLYFKVEICTNKKVMNGKRKVLQLTSTKDPKWEDGAYDGEWNEDIDQFDFYKVNKDKSIEIPQRFIKAITYENGKRKFNMISTIDDKHRKLLIPWLDDNGKF